MKTLTVTILLFVYTPSFSQSNQYFPDSLTTEARKDTIIARQDREIHLLKIGAERREERTATVWFAGIMLVVVGLVQSLAR